jgi:prevent-host-death family protein
MVEVNIHEAKTHLSRLLVRVSAGEEVIIAKAGTPLARLVPYGRPVRSRVPGLDRGVVSIPEDFDAPLDAGLLKEFES